MRRTVLALIAAAVLVSGCSSSKGPTLDYTPKFSILTEPGINQVKESRHARFDLRDLEAMSVNKDEPYLGSVFWRDFDDSANAT